MNAILEITHMLVSSNKKRILESAEFIMAEKGKRAKISEIAAHAGVNDSMIYHYYNNKEDLLFSVAEERLSEIREEMEEQLYGILDPIEKLRKLIWFRLHYIDKNRDYGDLLMFECRSNLNFFKHRAFSQARWFLGKLNEIVDSGIQKKVFRNDVKIWIVLDAVFGLMDVTNIMCLIGKTESAAAKLDGMMDLILSMLVCPSTSISDSKRSRILRAAEEVFAEKGYDKAKIHTISQLAGVADGTVYEYFSNKEDLLFSSLETGIKPSYRKRVNQEYYHTDDASQPVNNSLEACRRFIRQYFLLCLTHRNFSKILVLNGIFNRRFYGSSAYSALDQHMAQLPPLIEEGKRNGNIRQNVNSRLVINMLLGAFSLMNLRWIYAEKKTNLNKAGEIDDMVNLLMSAIQISPEYS